MPVVKTGMTNIAGHFCSYIRTVSQAGSNDGYVTGSPAQYENQA